MSYSTMFTMVPVSQAAVMLEELTERAADVSAVKVISGSSASESAQCQSWALVVSCAGGVCGPVGAEGPELEPLELDELELLSVMPLAPDVLTVRT